MNSHTVLPPIHERLTKVMCGTFKVYVHLPTIYKKPSKGQIKTNAIQVCVCKCTLICLQRKGSGFKIKKVKEKWDSTLHSLADILHLGYFSVFSNSL